MLRLAVVAAAMLGAGAASAHAAECPNAGAVKVPGAEREEQACLDDLTTAGTSQTGHTDQSDWGTLSPRGQRNPTGVPGLQVDGYFPDTSTSNATHGWNHDSQFVIRFPNRWNGKLVITGAPGVRKQYAHDFVVGDFLLGRGYAYASTDKGNGGNTFYRDGEQPGDAGVEWNFRVTQLAIAAKEAVAQRYARPAERTYITGVSQGGYLTRWQIENRPDLFDGGVDWEGTLWTDRTPNVFTLLPAAMKNYPRYRATGDRAAHDAMIDAGFAPGSEFLWEDHYGIYWDLTQRSYRAEFDPDYDGDLPDGVPFCQPGTPNCDADYDFAKRPESVKAALRKIALTGRIRRPMLSLHGTLDSLLPIGPHGDMYARMIAEAGSDGLHRYYVIENGNHVDQRHDLFGDRVRPIYPCWTAAFEALERWVERGDMPALSQFVPDPGRGDKVNGPCELVEGPDVIDPGVAAPTGTAGGGAFTTTRTDARRRRPRGLTVRVTRRRSAPGRRFVTTGRLLPPQGIAAAEACASGVISVQVKAGPRTVSTRRTRLRGGCTFRSSVTFRKTRRLGRRPLTFRVRFFGNRVATGINAAPRRVRLRSISLRRTP